MIRHLDKHVDEILLGVGHLLILSSHHDLKETSTQHQDGQGGLRRLQGCQISVRHSWAYISASGSHRKELGYTKGKHLTTQ